MKYKMCNKCKRNVLEYMLDNYPHVYPKGICPSCGKISLNALNKKNPDTPFDDPDQEELFQEFEEFRGDLSLNVGGHMINPPEDCEFKVNFGDKAIWVNVALCGSGRKICKKVKSCSRFNEFKLMSLSERKEELLDNLILI